MDALALLEDHANGRIRLERVFRDREDFLAHDDDWLISRFRLPRALLLDLIAELSPILERPTHRNRAIPAHIKVLTALGFLATGSFQRELSDRSGISQPSLSAALPAVLDGIIQMTSRYIRFPYTVVEQANSKRQFAAMSGFPNVIGAIDCTHIAIRAPSENEFVYVNRKNVHTINVQIICDPSMVLTNLVARWPGSTHDSFILAHSGVGNRLQAGAGRDGWLLGDSGYPLRRWLLTPFPNPQSAEERRFNIAHGRARSVVERAIGLLKNRWRCLDASGGRLLYHPRKVCKIIRACGVLHNLALRDAIPLPPDLPPPQHVDPDPQPPPRHEEHQHGARLREEVMRRV
ncbi:putative nuclease HARBI1 [Epinephelus moara]|uniref:putative nuclease HARBI1 n=1 Tax=Epinephelus lanceolatus TaxID=310571 RepID=UPI0014489612|nr:putative nuclease HARBI1 [Epinephelus lanceolatus]XP_049898042.1 putative nuclease HARBI1 [Epinephelus moara]XP_049898043.1 putative nuclease HARBI1 [Epinephelus moara]XP_049916159.1 putative nuclease HARBI1 [Epinephelus moara]XP_049916160.1 putative nuclease HARBI1 [Epinephelus moara]XP_049920659.1 putative nuclease HARBI1 [Epinephelus moara]XP_049920660.1 putative nuclease HARBI1 [Epinephelus moara]